MAVIAVYSYFICQILATQHTERAANETNSNTSMPVPLFSVFYFIFLVGWLKVKFKITILNGGQSFRLVVITSNSNKYNLAVKRES